MDCSYRGQRFAHGRCPGCGSANIRRLSASDDLQATRRGPLPLLLCLATWLYLAVEIYKRNF